MTAMRPLPEIERDLNAAQERRDMRGVGRFRREIKAATTKRFSEEVKASRMIDMTKIRTDGGTQSRAAINDDTVAEYAEALEGGAEFPPVTVYHDGTDYWLADGFHRVAAYRAAGRAEIPADVRQGDRRAAVLHSCGANASHGLRRTNADKRRAVMVLLEDAEWSGKSENWMAATCRVSRTLVRAILQEGHLVEKQDAVRTVERGGVVYQQDTSRIGKAKARDADEDASPSTGAERASATDALQSGEGEASGGGDERAPTPAPEAADPYAAERKGLADYTREGLEDALVEARAALANERAKRKAAEVEAKKAKAQIAEYLAAGDQVEVVRRQAKKIERLESEVWRAKDEARRSIAAKRRAEDRAKELERMGVPL